jgi:hypothetical protein
MRAKPFRFGAAGSAMTGRTGAGEDMNVLLR